MICIQPLNIEQRSILTHQNFALEMISCSKPESFEISRNFDFNFLLASNVEQIIDQLKTLTLMESTELVDQIETVFGIDASVPVGPAMVPVSSDAVVHEPSKPSESSESSEPSEPSEPTNVEEKATFDVRLDEVPEEKEKRVPV